MKEELVDNTQFVPIIIHNQETQNSNDDVVKIHNTSTIYVDILGKKNIPFLYLKKISLKNASDEYCYHHENTSFLNIILQNSINGKKWIDKIVFKNNGCEILQKYKYTSEVEDMKIHINSNITFYKYPYWCLKCCKTQEESEIEFLIAYNSSEKMYFYNSQGKIGVFPNTNQRISSFLEEKNYPFFEKNQEMGTINLEE